MTVSEKIRTGHSAARFDRDVFRKPGLRRHLDRRIRRLKPQKDAYASGVAITSQASALCTPVSRWGASQSRSSIIRDDVRENDTERHGTDHVSHRNQEDSSRPQTWQRCLRQGSPSGGRTKPAWTPHATRRDLIVSSDPDPHRRVLEAFVAKHRDPAGKYANSDRRTAWLVYAILTRAEADLGADGGEQ